VAGLVVALLAAAPARAGTVFGDIDVTVDVAPKGESNHGYTEYIIAVVNRSETRPHRVTLFLPRMEYHPRQSHVREVSRTVGEVGPGATVRVSLLQPSYPPVFGADLGVSIDDRRQEDRVRLAVQQVRVPGYYPPHFGGVPWGSGSGG
jgi:hypothetical protein